MDTRDFYSDKKWCPSCDEYVNYLMSVEHSFCTNCGQEVRLFSKEDWSNFNDTLEARKPKGGRPRKNVGDSDRESA